MISNPRQILINLLFRLLFFITENSHCNIFRLKLFSSRNKLVDPNDYTKKILPEKRMKIKVFEYISDSFHSDHNDTIDEFK